MQYSEQWRTCRKLIHQYFMENMVMKQHLQLVNAEAVQMVSNYDSMVLAIPVVTVLWFLDA